MGDTQMMDNIKNTPKLEEIMLQRELREQAEYERQVAEREEELKTKAHKFTQRQQRDQRSVSKELQNQKNCNHERGNRAFKKSPIPEHALYAHQLPTGQYFIKCLAGCGMRWNAGDTKETLLNREGPGKHLPNHTGLSFEDMWRKLPHEGISRSDVVMPSVGTDAPAAA
jgi:hypothetical protein